MNKNGKADYIITGQWAKKAAAEAQRAARRNAAKTSSNKNKNALKR